MFQVRCTEKKNKGRKYNTANSTFYSIQKPKNYVSLFDKISGFFTIEKKYYNLYCRLVRLFGEFLVFRVNYIVKTIKNCRRFTRKGRFITAVHRVSLLTVFTTIVSCIWSVSSSTSTQICTHDVISPINNRVLLVLYSISSTDFRNYRAEKLPIKKNQKRNGEIVDA